MIDKPFGISGCFRLRNESQFMEVAILSHLPYLDEAVLVVQPSDDDTVEWAHFLARVYPKIRVEFYDYVVDWIGTDGFYEKDPDEFGHLVHLSNWALDQCKYSWIAKIEGDVICLSTFERIIEQVHKHPDKLHYYGRMLLNVAGEKCDLISANHPRNAGWDVGVFPNDPRWRFERQGKWESITPGPDRVCFGWSGLHMKRSKTKNLRIGDKELWLGFEVSEVRAALEIFNNKMNYIGEDNPLGEACLFEKEWIDYYLEGETCLIPA